MPDVVELNRDGSRVEMIDTPERWFMDNYRVWSVAGLFATIDVDMTASKRLVERMRKDGFWGTYAHLFVRALAVALKRRPELHFMIDARKRHYPERVDLCIPIGTRAFVPPVLILKDAGSKPLHELSRELMRGAGEIFNREPEDFATIRRWGRWLPSSIRRTLLSRLWSSISFRRQKSGTFQITCLNEVDVLVPTIFPGTAIIATGRVRDRVVAVDGKPAVCPMATIVCAADHKAWNGLHAQKLLQEMSRILERGELEQEWEAAQRRHFVEVVRKPAAAASCLPT